MPESDLLALARESGAFESDDEAERTIHETLRALASCLSAGERRDLTKYLPGEYAASIRDADVEEPTPLALEAFVERVRAEAAIDHPREKIRAALAALTQAVGEDEIADARAQLPPAYGTLFEPATVEPDRTFVDLVAVEGGFDHDEAATAAHETLHVLGHRLSKGEATDVAPYLRGEAADWLSRTATHDAEDFGADEFVSRVATRTDVDEPRAEAYTAAVGEALERTVPVQERQRVEAQLPDQYAGVLNLG